MGATLSLLSPKFLSDLFYRWAHYAYKLVLSVPGFSQCAPQLSKSMERWIISFTADMAETFAS